MMSSSVGALPSPTARLRSQRSWPIRRIALPAVRSRKVASSHPNNSTSLGASRPSRGRKSSSRELRVAIPRADRLAVVAAVDAVADGGPEFQRNRAFQFDRQVGDAATRVELIGRGDGPGRTYVDAAPA